MEKKARILVVDDLEVNRFLLQELVATLGHDTILADSGRAALEILERQKADLVLLDMMMPDMTGDEVLAKMAAHETFCQIPVIVVSALDDRQRLISCLENGAVDYLLKPFNVTILKARIFASLEKKQLQDAEKLYRLQLESANQKIHQQNQSLLENNRRLEREIEKRKGLEHDSRTVQKMALRNAHASGMADIANTVLHNIGNTLNSVNISCYRIQEFVDQSCFSRLTRANRLLMKSALAHSTEEKDLNLLEYYISLESVLKRENLSLGKETLDLLEKIELIRVFILKQQQVFEGAIFNESVNVNEVVLEVLKMQQETLRADRISTETRLTDVPRIVGQKSKLSFAVLSLILNARESLERSRGEQHTLTIKTGVESGEVFIKVLDTGVGIPKELLERIFNSEYTTKNGEPGFGLHNSANAVAEMEGRISAESDGPGKGASFSIYFPVDKKGLTKAFLQTPTPIHPP